MLGVIFSFFMILIVSIIVYRMISGKKPPDNSYTPFDHITGHSSSEFKEEVEEENRKD
ncbi:DUF3951 domain-containing protein [Oceanobacillus sp. CAU 1775]